MTWGQMAQDLMADLPAQQRCEALADIIDNQDADYQDRVRAMIEELDCIRRVERRLKRRGDVLGWSVIVLAVVAAVGWSIAIGR